MCHPQHRGMFTNLELSNSGSTPDLPNQNPRVWVRTWILKDLSIRLFLTVPFIIKW